MKTVTDFEFSYDQTLNFINTQSGVPENPDTPLWFIYKILKGVQHQKGKSNPKSLKKSSYPYS